MFLKCRASSVIMIITKKIRTLIKIEKYTEYKRLKSQTKHFMTKIIITIIIKNPLGPWSGLLPSF